MKVRGELRFVEQQKVENKMKETCRARVFAYEIKIVKMSEVEAGKSKTRRLDEIW